MSRESSCVDVLGINVTFRAGADMERARQAAAMLEKRYTALKPSGVRGKDIMLVYLALGLADELLQMQTQQEGVQKRLESLLEKIDTFM